MVHDEKAEGLREEKRVLSGSGIARSRGLERQARKRIGTHLRAMYESVVQQPIPDRFTDLIASLEDGDVMPEKTTSEASRTCSR